MSAKPTDQNPHDKTQDAGATGDYHVGQFTEPPPASAPEHEGTGEWTASGEAASAKSPLANDAPVSLPGTLNAKDAGADMTGGGTAFYLPQATGGAADGDLPSPAGTVDFPPVGGATGEYDPTAPTIPGVKKPAPKAAPQPPANAADTTSNAFTPRAAWERFGSPKTQL